MTLSEFLIPQYLDPFFVEGCTDLINDPKNGACSLFKHEQLPKWAKNILANHWNDNKGRIAINENGMKVMNARYSRVRNKAGVELKGPNSALETENEEGLVYEDPEVTFYRVAMAAVAIYVDRELGWITSLGSLLETPEGKKSIKLSVVYLKQRAVDFYTAMATLRFLPAGRTLRNAGAGKPVVANCVVLDMCPRTLDNYDKLTEALRLQERGSGVGFPFHMIEPGQLNNSNIGAGGFMLVADYFLACIEEDGRKGANMGMMRDDHPDIRDFIYAKSRSEFALRNFNTSVAITDKLMKLVTTAPDTPWMCTFEDKEYHPRDYVRKENGLNVTEIIDVPMTAGELFHLIVERAWCFGDPGCGFIDTVNKEDPSNLPINASNPCVVGDTLVSTYHMGPMPVSKLIGISFVAIVDGRTAFCKDGFFMTNVSAVVYELKTEDEHVLQATGDHRILLDDRKTFMPLEKLCVGKDRVAISDKKGVCTSLVVSITELKERVPVYDCTVPNLSSFTANEIIVHNCGEQFLPGGDVCNLGSVNLDAITQEGVDDCDDPPSPDYVILYETVIAGVGILDAMIDLSDYHPSFQDASRRDYRRIGLGIMGLGDMLYQCEVSYGSKAGRDMASQCMKFITETAESASESLAHRYSSFPAWETSKWGEKKRPMRNVSSTTIPPTGSTSIVAGVSSGCEPNFCLAYKQSNILDGKTTLVVKNARFFAKIKELGFWTEELEDKIVETGDLSQVTDEEIPSFIKDIFCTAMTLTGMEHLDMLICLQKHTANAVSKTINLPNDSSIKEIGDIYIKAWKEGCKGLTVYRDGSRTVQVLNSGVSPEVPDASTEKSECNTENCKGPIEWKSGTCYVCLSCADEGCVRKRKQPMKEGLDLKRRKIDICV